MYVTKEYTTVISMNAEARDPNFFLTAMTLYQVLLHSPVSYTHLIARSFIFPPPPHPPASVLQPILV